MRARTEIEHTASGRECIVITEIPYMVNKAEMIKKIADLINEKKIEGISYINDESDRNGMRIIVILKHDAVASVVLNTLYKNTPLQTSFAVNNIALVNGRPMMLNLLDLVRHFVEHRHDVIVRRTRFDLAKAEKRLHIVLGLLIAQDNIDEIIRIIRAAKNPDLAKQAMMDTLQLERRTGFGHYRDASACSDGTRTRQAGCRAQRAGGADRLFQRCAGQPRIADEDRQGRIVGGEGQIRRRTALGDRLRFRRVQPGGFLRRRRDGHHHFAPGYIKRTPLAEYRTRTGARRRQGSATRDEDFIEHIYMATMHNTMLFFTEKGRCYWLKVYEIPEGTRSSKGRAIQNVIQIEPDDKVRAYINVKRLDDAEYVNNNYIIMCTKDGTIKKTKLEAYSRPRQNGVNAS